jgi:hypothetical protein
MFTWIVLSAVPEASCQHKCIGADWTITCEYHYQDAQILFLRISGFATFSSIQEDAIVIKGGKKLWIIALFHCLPNMLTEKLNLITNCFLFDTRRAGTELRKMEGSQHVSVASKIQRMRIPAWSLT